MSMLLRVLSVLLFAGCAFADRPNFVFLIADDISWDDVGYAGHPTIKTPNIDRLAKNGMRFNNAYLTTSSCSPSRCSIITGRYPHNMGAPELHTTLPKCQVLFPKLLQEAGYYTALSGKQHMGGYASTAFDLESKGKGPGKEADWVELLQKRPKNKPFFFWFASTDAHRNWAFNDKAPRYKPEDVVVPPYLIDGPKTREDLTGYYHEVSRFDHYVGAVADELKAQGVLENTLIIVIADNGRPLPRCKTRLYDSGIKTPFVAHWPARVKPAVSDSLISVIDIAATLIELGGAKKDERIQGISITSILDNPKAITRDLVFAEHNWHVYKNHERMVRMGDWLYIRNNFPDQQNLCKEAFIGGAGEELFEMAKAGKLTEAQKNVFWNPCPPEELYHVGKDPHQLKNVADQTEHAGILKGMRMSLATWSKQTGDTVPDNPTPDRDGRPGGPKKERKKHKRGDFPGASKNAMQINHRGPVRLLD